MDIFELATKCNWRIDLLWVFPVPVFLQKFAFVITVTTHRVFAQIIFFLVHTPTMCKTR